MVTDGGMLLDIRLFLYSSNCKATYFTSKYVLNKKIELVFKLQNEYTRRVSNLVSKIGESVLITWLITQLIWLNMYTKILTATEFIWAIRYIDPIPISTVLRAITELWYWNTFASRKTLVLIPGTCCVEIYLKKLVKLTLLLSIEPSLCYIQNFIVGLSAVCMYHNEIREW